MSNMNNNPNNFSSASSYGNVQGVMNTAPWNPIITRNLCDKLYEKRKQGAQEVQLFVRELCSAGFEKEKITYIIDFVLEHLLYNSNPNHRKGGLISLSAVALALGTDFYQIQRKVMVAVINTLIDQDARVRYYACESLLNILKISRHRSLPFFNDIFDNLCKLSADPEEQVRSASQLVDRLLKEIICESDSFDLEKFIPLLRERILINNPYVRQYILGWISVLNTVKHIDMKEYFAEFLDGVFIMLGDNNKDIQRSADNTLGEFLNQLISLPNPKLITYSVIFKIIVPYCGSKDETTRLIALTWISELIKTGNEQVLPYINAMIGGILPLISNEETTIRELAIKSNSLLLKLIENANREYPMELLIQQVLYHLRSDFVNTRLAALRWIVTVFKKSKDKFLLLLDDLFPPTLKLLSDFADPVATMALEVLCTIAYNEMYFTKLMENLLRLFKSDQNLFEKRGALTFRQLSLYIDPSLVLKTTAEIVKREREEYRAEFTNALAEMINMVFLTSLEFQEIRKKLTNNLSNEEIRALFTTMFEFFSHSPIATFTLCLIAQCYKLACDLITIIADFDISVNFLIEIDKLIQLIESPLFTAMRFQLLEPEEHPYLFKCLYGLLMIIPQSSSFHVLSNRLNSITPLALLDILPKPDFTAKTTEDYSEIEYEKLLRYFQSVQESHYQYRSYLQKSNIETYISSQPSDAWSQYEDYMDSQ